MSKEVKGVMDKVVVRYKGIYDFDGLYKLIRGWLDERRYDFMETRYKDKAATPFGNEVEIIMAPEIKVTPYIKYHIDIRMLLFDYKEFDAVLDGEKKKVTDGKISIELNGWVEFDYMNKFKTDFQKSVLNFLVDKLLRRYFEFKHYDKITYDVYNLQTEIKNFLKMETKHSAY